MFRKQNNGSAPHMTSTCYYSNDGQQPYISDIKRKYFNDGGPLQDQPFKTQLPLIFTMFYSDANIQHIGRVVLSRGFNSAPTREELHGFMDKVYNDDMPGAYNILDPTRTRNDLPYARYYVNRLNDQLLTEVLRNMSIMKRARLQYLRDISGNQGVAEIVRPIYTECKTRGPPLELGTRLLPQPRDGHVNSAYNCWKTGAFRK